MAGDKNHVPLFFLEMLNFWLEIVSFKRFTCDSIKKIPKIQPLI